MTQDVLYHFVKQLNSEFIGPILVFVLLGAGVFFTFRFKFIPRYYLRALRDIFKSSKGGEKATVHSGMSPLQALSTSIASQVGTGNIVGVAMALLVGGPGALFWMWVSAIFGMSTNFAEAISDSFIKHVLPTDTSWEVLPFISMRDSTPNGLVASFHSVSSWRWV